MVTIIHRHLNQYHHHHHHLNQNPPISSFTLLFLLIQTPFPSYRRRKKEERLHRDNALFAYSFHVLLVPVFTFPFPLFHRHSHTSQTSLAVEAETADPQRRKSAPLIFILFVFVVSHCSHYIIVLENPVLVATTISKCSTNLKEHRKTNTFESMTFFGKTSSFFCQDRDRGKGLVCSHRYLFTLPFFKLVWKDTQHRIQHANNCGVGSSEFGNEAYLNPQSSEFP